MGHHVEKETTLHCLLLLLPSFSILVSYHGDDHGLNDQPSPCKRHLFKLKKLDPQPANSVPRPKAKRFRLTYAQRTNSVLARLALSDFNHVAGRRRRPLLAPFPGFSRRFFLQLPPAGVASPILQ